MKIRVVQGSPKVGEINYNLKKIEAEILVASKENCDAILFPELFLAGYPLEDRILLEDTVLNVKLAIKKILLLSQSYPKLNILLPTPLFEKDKTFNAVLLIKEGFIMQKILKSCLPNYGVFDEKRYFSTKGKPQISEINGKKVLIVICEEIWNDNYISITKKLNPEFVFCINASPFERDKFEKRIERARLFNVKTFYINAVLGYDEILFDGRSFALSSDGRLLFEMPSFEEKSITYNFSETSKVQPLKQLELLYKALVFGLKEYLLQNGFKGVILGLSGGIDSALCAKIAIDAVGKENVLPIFLPSKISSHESKTDALEFIKLNGLSPLEFPIEKILKSYQNTLPELTDLSNQNLQSRIRGTMLMAISNQTGKMLITTGNKSEISTGYCTIYGDMNGGFNPIKDLFKTEVFELCNFINSKSQIFPTNMITKAPTAELTNGQTDEVSLGIQYQNLDFILKKTIEEKLSSAKLEKLISGSIIKEINTFRKKNNLQILNANEVIKMINSMLSKSQFKRAQSAFGTKISSTAFGRDWRFGLKY